MVKLKFGAKPVTRTVGFRFISPSTSSTVGTTAPIREANENSMYPNFICLRLAMYIRTS
jgi:hypothetical protein